MFTFHWSELLIIVAGGLVLLLGLSLLMLRRRNEMLEKFLTPETADIEEEFFRIRHPQQEEAEPSPEKEPEQAGESEIQPPNAEAEPDAVQWGTPPE